MHILHTIAVPVAQAMIEMAHKKISTNTDLLLNWKKKKKKKQRKVHEPILHVIVNALSKTYVILAQFSTDLHIKHLVDPDAFILGI